MKSTFVFLLALLSVMLMNAQNLIYVNQAATGANNGSSWPDAFNSFQDALDLSATGDEIWVAAGTYLPSKNIAGFPSTSRDATFYFWKDLSIHGGFVGTETSLSQRNCNTGTTTILSGDLGTVGNPNDNAYNVCFSRALTPAFTMDCMTISDGNGDTGTGVIVDGGGWYNHSNGQTSNPSFTNCIFENNYGQRGGGFYNNAENGGETNGSFLDCTFQNNNAEFGAGLFNNGSYGDASPSLTNCTIRQNHAGHGGGIYNDGQNGQASGSITACYFGLNTALFGAGIYNMADNGTTRGNIANCNFDGNNAQVAGGAMANTAYNGDAKLTVLQCEFRQNQCGNTGGAVWNHGANPRFELCNFAFNTSNRNGGAMFNDGSQGLSSSPTVLQCNFDQNQAVIDGGAIYSSGVAGQSEPQVLYCKFRQNRATNGGACFQDGSVGDAEPLYYNCIFSRNVASQAGGAAYLTANTGNCSPYFASCSFYANQATDGSLLFARQSNGGNSAAECFNIASFGHTGIIATLQGGAMFETEHGIYEASTNISCSGTCLPGIDPQYTNPSLDDLTLLATSPAIDQGNSVYVHPFYSVDLAGNVRVQGPAIDLGAYETIGIPPCPRVLYVNQASFGNNDGTSWADAFLDLQHALAEARVNPCIDTILIAEGTYKPSQFNRFAYYELVNDIEIYGGFPSTGNPWFPQRDLVAHETILSGDLGQQGNFADNSFVVVSGKGTTMGSSGIQSFVLNSGTILHGVSITGANQVGLLLWGDAGTNCEMIIDSCSFYNSGRAIHSIAMANGVNMSPTMRNCIVRNNSVWGWSPVIFESITAVATVSPLISGCLFKDNSSTGSSGMGGALLLRLATNPTVINCEFDHNRSYGTLLTSGGGAVMLENSLIYTQHQMNVQLLNCSFHDNIAVKGGAIFCYNLDFSNPVTANLLKAEIVNCSFSNNNATKGSTLYSNGFMGHTEIFVRNCISWGNNPVNQGSVIFLTGAAPVLHQVNISNSLFDAPNCNANSSFFAAGAATINCIGGNIFNQNPQFVNAAGGNYRLSPSSPAINAGSNGFVLSNMPSDIIGNVRIDNGTVDMGCYENFPGMLKENEASAQLVDNLALKNDFQLSPNPAREKVNVQVLSGEVIRGELLDMTGRIVQQWQGEIETLDISLLPAGVYLVRMQFAGNNITKRLIKE